MKSGPKQDFQKSNWTALFGQEHHFLLKPIHNVVCWDFIGNDADTITMLYILVRHLLDDAIVNCLELEAGI